MCTGWNLRSRATSFSMWFRYSVSVVAPIILRSPRASRGFSMLATSIAPGWFPAPTTVWSSSTNVMVCPWVAVTASRVSLTRFSNVPRYSAPASMAAKSRDTMVLSASPVGMSPVWMRWANPSTTAVFPTPGSPMRTGLFFRRLERTWMSLRISVSRPMTGSSSPFFAAATRSVPHCCSGLFPFWLLFCNPGLGLSAASVTVCCIVCSVIPVCWRWCFTCVVPCSRSPVSNAATPMWVLGVAFWAVWRVWLRSWERVGWCWGSVTVRFSCWSIWSAAVRVCWGLCPIRFAIAPNRVWSAVSARAWRRCSVVR